MQGGDLVGEMHVRVGPRGEQQPQDRGVLMGVHGEEDRPEALVALRVHVDAIGQRLLDSAGATVTHILSESCHLGSGK